MFNSTDESGEPTRRDPEEGRGHCIMEPLRGNLPDAGGDGGDIETDRHLNETSEGSGFV